MDDSASIEIRARERINSNLAEFWGLPVWTPAMGALLVAGGAPVPGECAIPRTVGCLGAPGTAASRTVLHDATRALRRWEEHWQYAIEDGEATTAPMSLTPFDFLLWCQEEYENSSDYFKPGWLRYWLIFTRMETGADAPLPVPAHIVAHAVALENFADVYTGKSAKTNQHASATLPASDAQRMITAVIASIEEDARSEISGSIIKAIRSTNSVKSGPVWQRLRDMSRNREHGLQVLDKDTLLVPLGTVESQKYTRKTFSQWLRRHRKNAAHRLRLTQGPAADGKVSR